MNPYLVCADEARAGVLGGAQEDHVGGHAATLIHVHDVAHLQFCRENGILYFYVIMWHSNNVINLRAKFIDFRALNTRYRKQPLHYMV